MRSALFRPFQSLAALAGESHSGRDEINVAGLAALTGHPLECVRQRLKAARPLRLLGLLEDRNGGDYAPSGTVLHIAGDRRGHRTGPTPRQRCMPVVASPTPVSYGSAGSDP